MAQIDVSDILSDPEFVDPIVVVKRTPSINSYGQNELSECKFQSHGSVQSVSGKTLQRLPEALRVANLYSFWVRGNITADGTQKYPDQLVFRGQKYNVQHIFDWTNWGAGWCEGTCIRERIT